MSLLVSNSWKNAIEAQFRYPGYLRIQLTVAPPSSADVATITSEDTESITSTVQLISSTGAYCLPVATLEQNRWRGDGTQYLPSEKSDNNLPLEWWSSTTNISRQNPATLTFEFSSPISIPGISIDWDVETNSYPTYWAVLGYNKDNSLLNTYEIQDTKSNKSYNDTPFQDASKIVIKVYQWSRPNWRARVNAVVFGPRLYFNNDKINSASHTASTSLLAEELPTCKISCTINNYDSSFDPQLNKGYSKYLAQRQLLTAQWGFMVAPGEIEWMQPWPLYLTAWTIPTDTPEVTLEAQSRLNFIDSEYIGGKYDGATHSMYDIAEHVLKNSNIIREYLDETPWELPLSLKNFYTKAPMPISPANAILQLIANSTGHILDTNLSNGYVRFREIVTSSDYTISMAQQLGDPSFKLQDRLKRIKIGIHSYSMSSNVTEVYSNDIQLSKVSEITCYFNSDQIVNNPSVSVTGATFNVVATYARAMIIELSPNPGNTLVHISIQGNVVAVSTTLIETYVDNTIDQGFEVTLDNELVTEMETVTYLTQKLIEYYSRRKYLSMPYTGYPELEVGDRITCITRYGESVYDITKTNLEYNGGFSGTIEILDTSTN